jgi:hypothetical protein
MVRAAKPLQKTGHEDAWEIVESAVTEARKRFETEMTANPVDEAKLMQELAGEDDQ